MKRGWLEMQWKPSEGGAFCHMWLFFHVIIGCSKYFSWTQEHQPMFNKILRLYGGLEMICWPQWGKNGQSNWKLNLGWKLRSDGLSNPKEIQARLKRQHRAVGEGTHFIRAADFAAVAEIPQRGFLGNDHLSLLGGKYLFEWRLWFKQGHKGAR